MTGLSMRFGCEATVTIRLVPGVAFFLPGVRRCRCCCMRSNCRSRMTEAVRGVKKVPFAWIASTAAIRSCAASDFNTNPRAPESTTWPSTSLASCIDNMRIFVRDPPARIFRAACSPSTTAC